MDNEDNEWDGNWQPLCMKHEALLCRAIHRDAINALALSYHEERKSITVDSEASTRR